MRLSLLFTLPFMGIVNPVFADQIQTVQRLLNELGYNAGVPDGIVGRKTTKAVTSFYTDNDRTFDGVIDDNEVTDLTAQINGLYGSCSTVKDQTDVAEVFLNSSSYLPDYDRVMTTIPAYVRGTFGDIGGGEMDAWIIASSDVNNDGISDIYVEYTETAVPPAIYLGTPTGKFTVLPNPIETTRRSINMGYFADLNNNGYQDFIGFVTSDHVEFFHQQGHTTVKPGEADLVLMNIDGNTFKPTEIPEAHRNDVNHGGIISDVDNDGYVDLIPLTESNGLRSYPVKNIGGDEFVLSKHSLPKIVTKHWIEDGKAGDLDSDGFDDYVISLQLPSWARGAKFDLKTHVNNHKPLLIIYGDGDFDFSNNRTMRVGKYWFDADTVDSYAETRIKPSGRRYTANNISFGTSNISLIDLNADGQLDILEGQFFSAPRWETSGFQAYLNHGDCFELATDKLFPDQGANRIIEPQRSTGYIKKFHFGDINQDGLLDVLLQGLPIFNRQSDQAIKKYPYIFLGEKNGSFLPIEKSLAKEFFEIRNIVTGDFNGDKLIDLAGTELADYGSAKIVTFLAKPIDEILLQKRSANTTKLRLKWIVSMRDDDYKEFLESEDTLYINTASEIIDIEGIDYTDEGVSGRDTLEYSVANEMLKIKGAIVLFGNERLYVNFSAPLDAKQVSRTFGPQDKLILTWEFE